MPVQRAKMLARVAFALLAVLLVATPAAAGGFRSTLGIIGPSRAERPFVVAPPGTFGLSPIPRPVAVPRPVAPSREVFEFSRPDRGHHGGHHGHRHQPVIILAPAPAPVVVVPQYVYPATAYVAPRQCESPGYWAYRQVPFTTAQNVWVEGSWSSDGRWIDSHWELRPYSSFYNEPFWVPGQSYAC